MEESTSYFENPIVWVFLIPVLIFIFVGIYYAFMRWVFDVRKQTVLLEAIYEKMGGDTSELYRKKMSTLAQEFAEEKKREQEKNTNQ